MANNVVVRAAIHELIDEISVNKPYLFFKPSNICICRIISVYDKDPNNVKINVSLKESIIKYPIILHMKDLVQNNFYKCQVISENSDKKYFMVNIIGSTFVGKLLYKNIKEKSKIKVGDICNLQLIELKKEDKKYSFSNLEINENFDEKIIINPLTEEMKQKSIENMEIYKNIQNIISEAVKQKEMQELVDINMDIEENEKEEINYDELVNRHKNKLSDDENENEEEENEESEEDENIINDNENIVTDNKKKFELLTKENEEMEIEEENENEEEGEEENENKKRKKSSKKENDNLKKELKIREIEKANENESIKNAQYYEKIILQDHDNSIHWIEYASYILDTLNLESARQIFERALKVIDIAKGDQKLNIWVAYLNLENIYGNEKSFQKILDRAKEVCDKKKLYNHLIQIYMNSNKISEANDIYKNLTKDYFNDYEIWKKYIEFLFEVENKEDTISPKDGLNKSMQVLDKKSHLDIMCWYAQLLYKYNKFEEARNMFDNIVKNFPKRKDIWFIYIDKEIKFGKNLDKVRQIFDKMFEIKFKVNDLKSIMKKFLEFEKENAKNEKEFLKAQEKTKEILEKRMAEIEKKNKDNEEEDNDEE